jgi:hypothetical protein
MQWENEMKISEATRRKMLEVMTELLLVPEKAPPRTWEACEEERRLMESKWRSQALTQAKTGPDYGIMKEQFYYVDSSAIKSLMWRTDKKMKWKTGPLATGVLFVTWHSGGWYRLEGVHRSLMRAWLDSDSKGRFWHDWIKGRFDTWRWSGTKWVEVPRKRS